MRQGARRAGRRVAAAGLYLAIASMAVLGVSTPAQAQKHLDATVGYYPGALISLPVLVANDQKFFDKDGLTVELVPISTGPAMTSAVASGSVTFVNNSWDNLLVSVSQGLPVRGVAGSTIKMPFALIGRKGLVLPHAKQGYPAVIKDLVGKKWGVLALGVSVQYISQILLTGAGYKPDDVTFLAVGLPNTARPALQRGTIDTYLSVEPLPSIVAARQEGTVILNLDENQGPDIFHDLGYNGWWATTATIKEKPEIVSRFEKSLEDAYCWYSKPDNLDSVVTILQRYVKVPELSGSEYKTMVKQILPSYGLDITARTIDTWSRLLVDQKLISAPKTRSEVFAPTARENFRCAN